MFQENTSAPSSRVKSATNKKPALLAACFCWCLAWLTVQPCSQGRYIPPKHQQALSDITTHKNVLSCILVPQGYFSPKMTLEAATELKHLSKTMSANASLKRSNMEIGRAHV
jgi:hypothetical protein